MVPKRTIYTIRRYSYIKRVRKIDKTELDEADSNHFEDTLGEEIEKGSK